MFLVTTVFLSLVFFSLADTQNVQIIDVPFYSLGPDIPRNSLAALVGDILVFSIVDTGQHTFAQTSPDHPCVALPDGFSTGAGARGYADFAIQMLDRDASVYYSCMHHCHYGEVGTVNAPLDPSDSGSLAAFVLAAKESNATDFTTAANLSAPGTYANGTLLVLSKANTQSIVQSHARTLPSWAFGLILIGICAITIGSLYFLARYCLRKIRAKAPADGEAGTSWELESVSSRTLVAGQPRVPARRDDPFQGFPI